MSFKPDSKSYDVLQESFETEQALVEKKTLTCEGNELHDVTRPYDELFMVATRYTTPNDGRHNF